MKFRSILARSPVGTLFKLMRAQADDIVSKMAVQPAQYTWEGTAIQDHLTPEDWKAIDKELSDQMGLQNDRGIAITYCALVEDRLRWLTERQLRQDLTRGELAFFFKGAGPLASAFSQTKFLHGIGVIERPLAETILRISEIRNKFAHNARPVRFTDPNIAALVEALRQKNPAGGVEPDEPIQVYGLTCFVIMTALLTLGQKPLRLPSPDKT